MPTFRINKSDNFTIINNHILRNKEASLKAKGLLVWMLSNSDDWNYSMDGMIQCFKDGKTAIKSALDELASLGYLRVDKLMPESTIDENGEKVVIRSKIEYVYNIYETPIAEMQDTDNQDIENLCIEKQLQRNTKEKEILREERASVPMPSNSNSRIHPRNFKKNVLVDDLKSHEYIEQQVSNKGKKKSVLDQCIDEIDEPKYGFSDDEKKLLLEYIIWANKPKQDKSENVKRIKSLIMWQEKLKVLIALRGTGESVADMVQQSIDRKWYVFVACKNPVDAKLKGLYNNRSYMLLNDVEANEQAESNEGEGIYVF